MSARARLAINKCRCSIWDTVYEEFKRYSLIVFDIEYISLSKSQQLHRGLQKSHQHPKTAFPDDSLTALRHPVRTGPIISMKAEAHDCRIVWIVVSQDVACEMNKCSHIDCAQLPPDSPVINGGLAISRLVVSSLPRNSPGTKRFLHPTNQGNLGNVPRVEKLRTLTTSQPLAELTYHSTYYIVRRLTQIRIDSWSIVLQQSIAFPAILDDRRSWKTHWRDVAPKSRSPKRPSPETAKSE